MSVEDEMNDLCRKTLQEGKIGVGAIEETMLLAGLSDDNAEREELVVKARSDWNDINNAFRGARFYFTHTLTKDLEAAVQGVERERRELSFDTEVEPHMSRLAVLDAQIVGAGGPVSRDFDQRMDGLTKNGAIKALLDEVDMDLRVTTNLSGSAFDHYRDRLAVLLEPIGFANTEPDTLAATTLLRELIPLMRKNQAEGDACNE